MSLAMRPNEVNTEVQYDFKVRRQAVIFFIDLIDGNLLISPRKCL